MCNVVGDWLRGAFQKVGHAGFCPSVPLEVLGGQSVGISINAQIAIGQYLGAQELTLLHAQTSSFYDLSCDYR